jgi:hypothetical protein
MLVAAPKVPVPVPARTLNVALEFPAMTRSTFPSPVTSAIASEFRVVCAV